MDMQVIKSVVHDFMMASSCDKVMMNWSFCLNERKWMDMQVIKGVVHDCTMACDETDDELKFLFRWWCMISQMASNESDDELKFWYGQLNNSIVK
jgi:hypothetical protein